MKWVDTEDSWDWIVSINRRGHGAKLRWNASVITAKVTVSVYINE